MTPHRTPARSYLLLGLLLDSAGLAAQETFTFTPRTELGCLAGQTVTSTRELSWTSTANCLTAELDADGQTLRFGPGDSQRDAIITARPSTDAKLRIVAPTDSTLVYGLSIWAEDPQGGRLALEGRLIFWDSEMTDSFLALLTSDGEICTGTVAGGSTLELLHVSLRNALAEGQPFRLRYAWTGFERGTVLSEVVVPERDFDGDRYLHDLPSGAVTLSDTRAGAVYVNTAVTKNEPQDIRLVKAGGSLVSTGYTTLAPGSAANGEPHRVTLALSDATLCLPSAGEILLDTGIVLTLTRTSITYGNVNACLGLAGGEIVVPADGALAIGRDGYGMQLFDGGRIRVEEGATLDLDCVFYLKERQSTIALAPGARVNVGAGSTSRYEVNPQKIRVEVAPGAAFDASAAPRQVQDLFEVVGTVAAPEPLPASAFTAFPNPAPAGAPAVTLASRGPLAQPIVRVDLLDAVGRVVAAETLAGQGAAFRQTVVLPGAGVYTARLTDASGAVAHLRLIGQ